MTNRKQVTARKLSLDRQKSLAFKGFPQKTLLEEVRRSALWLRQVFLQWLLLSAISR